MVPPETAARLMAPTGRDRRRWDALAPSFATEANVAGLPLSLVIAIWLVGAMWIVGLAAQLFQLFERPYLVRVFSWHGRSLNRVA